MLPSSYEGIQALITVEMLSQKTEPTSLSPWKPHRMMIPAISTARSTDAMISVRMNPREPFAMRLSNQ